MNYNIDDAQSTATQTLAHEAAAIVSSTTFSSVREGSSLVIRVNGVEAGVRPAINISAGTGISISGSDDGINNEVDINIVATGTSPILSVVTKTTAYTLTDADDVILVDASGGAVTITLHAVATAKKKRYDIKKIDSSGNAVTIEGNLAETIDGALNVATTTQYASYTVVPDGAAWYIV